MSGRKLKNYRLYLQRLELYAQAMGIKLIWTDEPGDGSYNHNNSSITLDLDLTQSGEIATLLHELGHAFDYHLHHKEKSPKIWAAYDRVYANNFRPDHLQTVIDAENRAWENGKIIAKRLKIKLGKWFAYEKKIALTNYRKS